MIQFPNFYPLKELFQKETKEIVQSGIPFFNFCWVRKEEFSLQRICINKVTDSPALMTSDNLENLPILLLKKIYAKQIQNRVLNATLEIFPLVNSPDNPHKKNNVFQFLNEFVFHKFLAGLPTLDIKNKNIEILPFKSIDITFSDFKINQPILRLMRENACVGISFILCVENGTKVIWTLMQASEEEPHIWYPFNKSMLFPENYSHFRANFSLKINDLEKAQKYATLAIKKPNLSLFECQNNIYQLVKTLKEIISGKSILLIENLNMDNRDTISRVVLASLHLTGKPDLKNLLVPIHLATDSTNNEHFV